MAGRRRRLVVAGALLVLLVPLFVPLSARLRHDPLLIVLGDRAHVPIFAGLALLLAWAGPWRGRPWAAAAVAAAAGAASELLQQLVGRSASLGDFVLDVIGIGLAVTWLQWRRGRRRDSLAAAALLLAALAFTMREVPDTWRAMADARRGFPVLADFEARHQRVLWRDRTLGGRVAVVEAGGGRGSVLRVATPAGQDWPGVAGVKLPADWTGWAHLELAARLVGPGPDSLRLAVRLDDYEGRRDSRWASRTAMVGRQWRTLRVPLADLRTNDGARPFQRDDVWSVSVFLARPGGPATFEIDDVRLTAD